jgi:hypothetical protein
VRIKRHFPPNTTQQRHHVAAAAGRHHFRRTTSWSYCLVQRLARDDLLERMTLLNLLYLRISRIPMPAYLRFQR